ncbi:MAG TPA: YaiO family outer membrane beta-barrel protein [Sphingobacteriaceae bacterium]
MGRVLFSLLVGTVIFLLRYEAAFCQPQKLSSDEFVRIARAEAAVKNIPAAFNLLKEALALDPGHSEARLFLGSLFASGGNPDSARVQYNRILKYDPANSRAIAANYILEFNNRNYGFALHFAEVGLKYHPGSDDFAAKKHAALKALGQTDVPEASASSTSVPPVSSTLTTSIPPSPKHPNRMTGQVATQVSQPAKRLPESVEEVTSTSGQHRNTTASTSPGNATVANTLSSDDLFQLARTEVFDRNNYQKGISYLKKALILSPNYADLRVFLGRIYTWADKIDSARRQFNIVLRADPSNVDAIAASFDLEYWNDNYGFALVIAEKGLTLYPGSEDFTLMKAKALNALKKNPEALSILTSYLTLHPGSKAISELQAAIQEEIRVAEAGMRPKPLTLSQSARPEKKSPIAPDAIGVSFRSGNLPSGIAGVPSTLVNATVADNTIQESAVGEEPPVTADALFEHARTAAFEKKNYPEAIALSKRSLAISDNNDVRLFLGRLYTWSDLPDSARAEFYSVLFKNPRSMEAIDASYDLELWNDRPKVALEYAETGLKFYPESENLTVKKAKALIALKRYGAATKVARAFLERFPQNGPVLALEKTIKDDFPQNTVGAGHSTVYFDKRFDRPWFLSSASYGRQTRFGSITLNVNHANRFETSGLEGEFEAYPRIAKGLYAYAGGGISGSSIFPNHRFGFSLYQSLPHSFEAEAGLRYLKFSDATVFYVFGIGRYIGNNFYGLRSYITPSNVRSSVSFNLSTRFYLGQDRFDSFGIAIGTGTSPDDRARRVDLNNTLNSVKAGFDYSATVIKRTALSLGISWANEEYSTATYGNQYTFSASLSHRF